MSTKYFDGLKCPVKIELSWNRLKTSETKAREIYSMFARTHAHEREKTKTLEGFIFSF